MEAVKNTENVEKVEAVKNTENVEKVETIKKLEVIEFDKTTDLVAAKDKGDIALFQITVENPPMPNRHFGIPAGAPIPTQGEVEEHFTKEGLRYKWIYCSQLPPPQTKLETAR